MLDRFSRIAASGLLLATTCCPASVLAVERTEIDLRETAEGRWLVEFTFPEPQRAVVFRQAPEPYRGGALMIRSSICGLIYAALWGVYTLLVQYLFNGQVEVFQLLFLAPPLIAAGGVAALASLDLDFTSGAMHFGSYVAVTVLLLYLMGSAPI